MAFTPLNQRKKRATFCLLLLLVCHATEAIDWDSKPHASTLETGRTPLFQVLTPKQTGIDLVHRFPREAPFNMLTDQGSGSGVCIGDVDMDGLPDLFFTNYDQGNRLYRNLGNLRFEDITHKSGLSGTVAWCGGTTFVDLDGDGDLDLFIATYNAPNLLFINRGNGVFDEKATHFGLGHSAASVMMAFADYDRDGDLDGYLVTHRLKINGKHILPKNTKEALQRKIIEIRKDRKPYVTAAYEEFFQLMNKGNGAFELIIAGGRDILYRNDGDKGFTEISKEAGVSGFDIGLAATWWDYNNDGWPDLYLSNDYKGADKLYRNTGDGTFQEVATNALPHLPWFSMGSDTADVNNDGLIDLFASDMSGTSHYKRKMGMGDMRDEQWFMKRARPRQYMRNALFLATGTERAFEAAALMGVANTDWSWSPKFGDFDNDGWMDLFVSNGMSRDFMNSDLAASIKSRNGGQWRKAPILKQRNLLFQNQGDLAFMEVGRDWGLQNETASYGAALGDLDIDGDLDLVVNNFEAPVSIYRNQSQEGRSMTLRLEGRASNRWGIGAKVSLEMDNDSRLVRTLGLSQGFMSSNEPILHFGLGKVDAIRSMTIQWPDGMLQHVKDLPVDHFVTLRQANTGLSPKPKPAIHKPALLSEHPLGIRVRHRESPHDDFQQQPLLPWKLSRSGPGMAVGDVDGNGIEDLYLGGAAGTSGQLLLRYAKSPPRRSTSPFAGQSKHEDMGALFFDLEGDGDLDLYVVSGGVECAPGHDWLQDRIYLNDGSGHLSNAPLLPNMRFSGRSVSAADFDRDGDLDLFIGGFSIPSAYPTADRNVLLRNEGGRLVDATAEVAPNLASSGLVSGSLWSDVDSDGWIDLLLCHHWGPVALFRNKDGYLSDATVQAGLSQWLGLWNGIDGGDVDGDGDFDYVVTNLGLNTKYHASTEKPLTIFYGDMDGTGTKRLIEAEFEGNTWYPVRGKSCSTLAMPSLRKKFPSFESFAIASLEDVYPSSRLQNSLRFDVTTLESGLLLNNGQGQFVFSPLPSLSQITASFGVEMLDLDYDGHLDVVLSQNSFAPQLETGHFDSGQGLILMGRGNGQWSPAWPEESGFSVPGDAKSMVTLDLNRDGETDLLIARNNDTLVAFSAKSGQEANKKPLFVHGSKHNPSAIGTRVVTEYTDGSQTHREIKAGSGYLSQSSPLLTDWIHPKKKFARMHLHWPDGTSSTLESLPPLKKGQHHVSKP
jgi:hypothetical protein